MLSYYLPVDSLIKQRLLEESEVHQRARLLSRILDELAQVVPDDDTVRFRIFPKPSWNSSQRLQRPASQRASGFGSRRTICS